MDLDNTNKNRAGSVFAIGQPPQGQWKPSTDAVGFGLTAAQKAAMNPPTHVQQQQQQNRPPSKSAKRDSPEATAPAAASSKKDDDDDDDDGVFASGSVRQSRLQRGKSKRATSVSAVG